MQTLPLFKTDDQDLTLLQSRWSVILNSLLRNKSLQSQILSDVSLTMGDNIVDHMLGRKLQGWRIVRMRDNFSQIYDTQNNNTTPQLTLLLNASADVTVDIEVF